MRSISQHLIVLMSIVAVVAAGCSESGSSFVQVQQPDSRFCGVDTDNFADGGVGKDGIKALTNPPTTNASDADYLSPDDRVIGLVLDALTIAVPHNILWHHEIVNLDLSGVQVAVTYCPLTGSSLVFDRRAAEGAEFGVSGLLFNNNLTMYDRRQPESLWPQMSRKAACGEAKGADLTTVASFEMSWSGWTRLFPETEVVSDKTGVFGPASYQFYPYSAFDYEELDNDFLLFPQGRLDPRRPPKERVLGLAISAGGKAYPFGELDRQPLTVVNDRVASTDVVVFWSRANNGAVAFDPTVDGRTLTFEVNENGFRDRETKSRWSFAGVATSGEYEGRRLRHLSNSYVAFWFAWAKFQPVAALWLAG